jgi:DNA-binding transcriptional MerR regulator
MNTDLFSQFCTEIFDKAIEQYHTTDNVDAVIDNPYPKQSVEYLLFLKNSIDTVQWHLEDIIRKPDIDAAEALLIKRRIDKSNQDRTDLVELIDSYFLDEFKDVIKTPDAKINTESPAWAIDRLSILALKIYHMRIETLRTDATTEHIDACKQKLKTLEDQQSDLSTAIDQLLEDIASGKKYMKTYKQMKMYNDPNLNPELYNKK